MLPLEWPKPRIIGANLFLDTNIWIDTNLTPVFVNAAGLELCRLSFSDYVIDEWIVGNEGRYIKGMGITREELAKVLKKRYAFVDERDWRRFAKALERTSNKDQPIAASARAAKAQIIVTENFKDFDQVEMLQLGLRAYPPDVILAEFLYSYPLFCRVFAGMRRSQGTLETYTFETVDHWNCEKRMPLTASALAEHAAFFVDPFFGNLN